ncbi:hypothetical protein [Micromonospora sp. DT231]|uniref:hypothetical protein n=1 Tax=Micromonospora sp. DT231 TaxID=3416526 RepID=UPI003CF8B7FC
MVRRIAIFTIGVLMVVGGATAFTRWQDARLADCQSRATVLETVPLLTAQPDGVQLDSLYSGCDVDRLVAYAGRHNRGEADERAIVSFYQQLVKSEAWLVTPSTAGVARLCASKDLDGGTAYMNLSFPASGTFDLHVAESADSGAQC